MRTFSTVLMSLVLAVAACDENENPPVPGTTSVPGTPDIKVVTVSDDLTFSPSSLSIRAGDVVIWRNAGAATHAVSCSAPFDATLPPNGTFGFQLYTAGTYSCRVAGRADTAGIIVVNP